MRSFVSLSLLLSLSLASQVQAELLGSVLDPLSDTLGKPFGRSDHSLVDASDVNIALDVLRRANYNFDDHILKRSDSWSWKEKGNICHCRPDASSTTTGDTSNTKPGSADKPGAGQSPGSSGKETPHETNRQGQHDGKSGKGKSDSDKAGEDNIDKSSGQKHNDSTSTSKNGGHSNDLPSSRKKNADDNSFDNRPFRKEATDSAGSTSSPSPPSNTGQHDSLPPSTGSSSSTESTSSSPSSPSSGSSAAAKRTCPSGYNYADKGNSLISNDHSLVDASKLNLSIDVLSFLTPSSPGHQTTTPAKDTPKCQTECCCYRTIPTPQSSCPSGYTSYSKGDSIVENSSSLVDLSHLSISLDILNLGGHNSAPVSNSAPATDKPTCDEKTCCVKQTTKAGDNIISNHGSLINASGIKIKACVLTLCA